MVCVYTIEYFFNLINNSIHLKNMVYDVAAFPVFSVPIAMFGLIVQNDLGILDSEEKQNTA